MEDSTTISNYQRLEEVYIKEEPLEEKSQDCDLYKSILHSVKKEECITHNDNQIYKTCDNPIDINNRSKNTNLINQEVIMKHSTNIANYQNWEEIYIKEEPLEENSQDCEFYKSILQNVKEEECISDNEYQIDKEHNYSVTVNNDIWKFANTNSNSYLDSLHRLCENKLALVRKLQEWKLIPRSLQCRKCGGSLKLYEDVSGSDGWRWRCPNKVSLRKQKARRCENTVLAFVNLWVGQTSLLEIQEQLDLSHATCVDWASFCREVLLTRFMNNVTKLGGSGHVVEIDGSKFKAGQWIFSGYERGTGRLFMVLVDDRGADTLIPLIEECIEPGTTIVSDFWRAYNCHSRSEYLRLKVNHSVNFRDPDTETNTNSIEKSWRAAKAISTSSGRKKTLILGSLARYILYKKCSELELNMAEEFYRLAGATYDATLPVPEEEEKKDMDIEDLDF